MKSILVLLLGLISVYPTAKEAVLPAKSNLIQVAILLDTSGSMSGLINQAKSQLWSILNTMSDAEMGGEPAEIEIALYEYGNDRLQERNGYVLQRVAFTSDMDKISESLFSMTTNGGEEYCGEVIHQSVKDLEWRSGAGLKVLYIAGNEPFSQGSFDFRVACMEASKKGVVINTIYCGNRQEGINSDWEAGAILGKGAYHHIDHNQETQYVRTPFDDKISLLNSRLNETYIHYGSQGKDLKKNMVQQDANAGSFSQENAVKRAVYKSKSQYKNSSWDLVDAYEENEAVLEEEDSLPEEYKGLSQKEIKEKILEQQTKRANIQKEISDLGRKRTEYINENATQEGGGLEQAVLESVNTELSKRGFCNNKEN